MRNICKTTYAKFNQNSPKTLCQSHHEYETWHYQQVNVEHVRKAVDLFIGKKHSEIST